MNPNTDQRSMRVYASDNTQYRTEPNEEQSRDGVKPLDSLPAAWWNWLWNEITSNNNNALLSITDLRTEIGNVLTNAGLTASAQVTNQLAQAIIIIHQRKPFFDDQHNPVPGSVISSAARSSVSVDGNTGQMTVNALSDWASQDSVKTVIDNIVNGGSGSIASLEQDIADLNQKTGTLANLTTTDKSNLVAAINEVDSHADSNAQAISDEVTARQNADSSLSQAISDEVTARQNAEGSLANLTTTDKSNLVAAINEINASAGQAQYSTSEFDTKKKWIDGKKIYGRVLTDLLIRFSQNTSFPTTYAVNRFAVFNNKLYVGTWGHGIYTSTDGVTFTQNTSFPTTYEVTAFTIFNNKLYVGTSSHGIYTSTDGVTFTQNTSFPTTYEVTAFTIFNNKLYVGTSSHGIYTSTDGVTFTQNTSFPTTYEVTAFTIFNNKLYVGTSSHGIYTSTDGVTFTQNTSFPTTYEVYALAVFNNKLYVGTFGGDHGIYTSTDGVTFHWVSSLAYNILALAVFNNKLYVGTSSRGIYTSTDGVTFTQNTSFPTTYDVHALAVFNNKLYVGTWGHGIYTSTDGVTFTQNTSFPTTYSVDAFAVFNNTLYIGPWDHGIYTSGTVSSEVTLSGISELLFAQLRSATGPLGLKSAYINSSNHLVVEGDGTPTQAIIEYTKTT